MTILSSEVYEALKQAGVKDDAAKTAAKSLFAVEEKKTLFTKVDKAEPANIGMASSFLQTAKTLKLDGPSDWSKNLDEYLYG